MIKIKYLAHFPSHTKALSEIWADTIGKDLFPEVSSDMKEADIKQTLNENKLPLSFVALQDNDPVGMSSLSMDSQIDTPELSPWVSLFFKEEYRSKGLAKLLIRSVKSKAFKMGFKKLYVVIFNKDLIPKYEEFGWTKVGTGKAGKMSGDIMEVGLTYRDLL